MEKIPVSATELNLEDTQAVLEVLRKRGLAGGLEPVEFERGNCALCRLSMP